MIKCYTDGSNMYDQKIAWSFVAVKNGREIHRDFGCLVDGPESYLSMWNVAGEIEGALGAIDYAKTVDDSVEICTDYKGLIKWTKGRWNADKRIWTKWLKEGYDSHIQDIRYVKAHSGHEWNEIADDLAKKALHDEEPLSSSISRDRGNERLVELEDSVIVDSKNVYDISKSNELDWAFDDAKELHSSWSASDFLQKRFEEAKRGNELSKKKIVLEYGKELNQ